MTRWTSLKAFRSHKSAPFQPVTSRRHLSAPTLATTPQRAQKSGAEPPSWHSPRGPRQHRLPASWPRQKQHQSLWPQTQGEVVNCGDRHSSVRYLPTAGDLVLD